MSRASISRRLESLERRMADPAAFIVFVMHHESRVDEALAALGLTPKSTDTVIAIKRFCNDKPQPPRMVPAIR